VLIACRKASQIPPQYIKRSGSAAQAYVDMRAGQVNHPAIVLDIDETSLSNWPEIIANDYGYIPSGERSWPMWR
jgi:hypothetical protein